SGFNVRALIVICCGHTLAEGLYLTSFVTQENDHGEQIRKKGIRESWEGNEGTQGGHAEKRTFRKKSNQSQAGDRNRAFRSAPRRRKSTCAEEKDVFQEKHETAQIDRRTFIGQCEPLNSPAVPGKIARHAKRNGITRLVFLHTSSGDLHGG